MKTSPDPNRTITIQPSEFHGAKGYTKSHLLHPFTIQRTRLLLRECTPETYSHPPMHNPTAAGSLPHCDAEQVHEMSCPPPQRRHRRNPPTPDPTPKALIRTGTRVAKTNIGKWGSYPSAIDGAKVAVHATRRKKNTGERFQGTGARIASNKLLNTHARTWRIQMNARQESRRVELEIPVRRRSTESTSSSPQFSLGRH
jgi:hypothetical protein